MQLTLLKFSYNHQSLIVLMLFLLPACSNPRQEQNAGPEPEAISFAGKPLYVNVVEAGVRAKSDSIIAVIKSKAQLSEDDYVEIGKQLVATFRYKNAVDLYAEGLIKYPESYKLLRNRGHRYITLRKLDLAIADLIKAEELIRNEPDVMEFGADGKPTATVRHQVWYHQGVYYYLNKDYRQAATAFEKALATAGDNKNVAGSCDWLYNSYQRLGEKQKAMNTIQFINASYLEDKEQPYFRRILLYNGIITPEQLIDISKDPLQMSVQDITKLYGLANWYAYNGNPDKANKLYKIILQSNAWPGFAYAAAEKDVSN